MALEGTSPAVEMGAGNQNTTSTCKGINKNVGPDGSPPAIVMGIETDATYNKDSGTKEKEKADNPNETLPANEMETSNMNINKASTRMIKEGPCKADNPQNAIAAGPIISKSSAATYMDALVDALSPECKAKPDKDETIPVAPPRTLPTLTSETMIPIFPATPGRKAVNKVRLSKSNHHLLSHTQNL